MSSPDITDLERQAVLDVLNTPILSIGPRIQAFEEAVAHYAGTKHAVSVSSGTAGLHLCIHAANVSDNDFVLTTPFSFVASSNAILFERAIPIFVDVDPITGNIDPTLVEEVVSDLMSGVESAKKWLPRKGWNIENGAQPIPLKAIIPVDVFGQPADMDPITSVANKYQIPVIEDSCEAIGAEYHDRKAGTLGDMGIFAFYPNKQMTTGEGGIIITNDDAAAEKMRALRNQGRVQGDTWLSHKFLGYNYRIDEMSAALGEVQLSRIDELLEKRDRVANWYNERLANITGIEIPTIVDSTTRMSWFVYVVRFENHVNRDKLINSLREQGIPARPYFSPIHLQPYMVDRFGYQPGDFPITEVLGSQGLALPYSGVMTEEQVDYVCDTLINSIR